MDILAVLFLSAFCVFTAVVFRLYRAHFKQGYKEETARHDRTQRDIAALLYQKHVNAQRAEESPKRVLKTDFRAPSIDEFHKEILSWNFSQLNSDKVKKGKFFKMPDLFKNYETYFATLMPMLLYESRAQVIKAKEEMSFASPANLTIKRIVHVGNIRNITAKYSNTELFMESDLLLLEYFSQSSHKQTAQFMAMVTTSKNMNESTELQLRAFLKNDQSDILFKLQKDVIWKAFKIINFVTFNREYEALATLPHNHLLSNILQPVLSRFDYNSYPNLLSKFVNNLHLNESQAQAVVLSAKSTSPFILIQGPPGTGKTKTIVGIISAYFSNVFTSSAVCISENKFIRKQLLVCAPSNGAVDEIVRRLPQNIRNVNGEVVAPKIIRFGVREVLSDDMIPFSLDYLLGSQLTKKGISARLENLATEIRLLNRELKEAETQIRTSINPEPLEHEIGTIKKHLFEKRKEQREVSKFIENLKIKLLEEADIICSTLSSSGHGFLLKVGCQFEIVIIDESCQSVELSSLIPLKYNCKKCILVGDPNQLPPTVISTAAQDLSYEQSLFQRIQKQYPEHVHMLNVQYRMHPSISAFPSKYFYDSKLLDAPEMDLKTKKSWHKFCYTPTYAFFDLKGKEFRGQRMNIGSYHNEIEAKFAKYLVQYICEKSPKIEFSGRIGVITPYRGQVTELKKQFKQLGKNILEHVEISTIDGFQGKEKDIIIFSCVRAGNITGIGFLADIRRLNVGLTRAKSSLFILGDARAFKSNSVWESLIDDARGRRAFFHVDNKHWANQYKTPINLANLYLLP